MSWSRRAPAEDSLDALLGDLGGRYRVIGVGGARLVVGPAGAYAVIRAVSDRSSARTVARLATTVRSALAEHMTWVPFVHALIAAPDWRAVPQATVVPFSLLCDTIDTGRETLEPETLERIDAAVAAGALNGLEAIAPRENGTGSASMDECASRPPTSSPSG